MERSTNRVGISVAGGLPCKKKRCRRVRDMAKKRTRPKASDVIIVLIERKEMMIQGMSTGVVMGTEGIGTVVAGGQNTAMIMRTETHVTDQDSMHSKAVDMTLIIARARKTGFVPIGIPMLKGQGMQIRTAAETGPITTDARYQA